MHPTTFSVDLWTSSTNFIKMCQIVSEMKHAYRWTWSLIMHSIHAPSANNNKEVHGICGWQSVPVSSVLSWSGSLLQGCSTLGVFLAEWAGHVLGTASCTLHQSHPICEPAMLCHSTCFHHHLLVTVLPLPTKRENSENGCLLGCCAV
jgi:hypothetical protein